MSGGDCDSVIDPKLVDLERLSLWMDDQGLPRGPLQEVRLLGGGTQNILVKFRRGGMGFVLRRPPAHLRANSNETMRREARVLCAIADTGVPHPRFIAGCPDTDVLGASFYLMEPVEGFNPTTGLPELHRSDAGVRRQMGLGLIDAIVTLGAVDYHEVGLEDFGKAPGYLERQVDRWRNQLDSYSQFEGYPGPEIPGVERVAAWLESNLPRQWSAGIIHGDYHLANVLYAYDSPRLAAIVDWELSTIGDPLLDLGWLLATWHDPDDPLGGSIVVSPWHGFPSPDQLVARYRERSTRDLSAIGWYAVLACYKLGIILEGTQARACAGKADRSTGDLLHATTVGLFERALKRMASTS